MKYIKPTKKLISVIALLGIVLTGAYFVLGEYGQSGPESASNLEEYGLVGHWTFEEGSGQTIYDRSGNGNDGTLGANSSVDKDDPVFAAGHDSNGPGGMGMSFDGVDDYGKIIGGDNLVLSGSDATFSAWVKPDTIIGIDGIIGNVFNVFGWWFALNGGVSSIWIAGNDYSGNTAVDTTEFSHIVITYVNSTKNINFYLNSEADGSAESANNIGQGGTTFYIGEDGRDGAGYPFDGIIDSVRIYNRALSADEIRMLYNQKKPVMELKFDEGSGTTAYDESWNGNDVTFPVADGNKPEWSAP